VLPRQSPLFRIGCVIARISLTHFDALGLERHRGEGKEGFLPAAKSGEDDGCLIQDGESGLSSSSIQFIVSLSMEMLYGAQFL